MHSRDSKLVMVGKGCAELRGGVDNCRVLSQHYLRGCVVHNDGMITAVHMGLWLL